MGLDIPGEVFKAIVDGAKAQGETNKAIQELAKDVHHLRAKQKNLATKEDLRIVAKRTYRNFKVLTDPNNPYLQAAIDDHIAKCHPTEEVQQVRALKRIKGWVMDHKLASILPPPVLTFLYYLYEYVTTGAIPWP